MEIIGITLAIIAISLIFWNKSKQEKHNEWLYGEGEAAEHGFNALMKDFTNYQVETDRKISELEKQLEIKTKKSDRKIDKVIKNMPAIVGKVVGQIEIAQERNIKR
jgi:hypothetical protein